MAFISIIIIATLLTVTRRLSTEVAAVDETPCCGDVTDGIQHENVSGEPEAVATDVGQLVPVRRPDFTLKGGVQQGTSLTAIDRCNDNYTST